MEYKIRHVVKLIIFFLDIDKNVSRFSEIFITYAVFKKNPPNSKNGMITGGPTDRAIETFVLAHEIK